MEFDKELFYEQYYRKQDDPEICDHPFLTLSFDIDNTHAIYKKPIPGQRGLG